MYSERAVHQCICGELLYAERIDGELSIVIRHGEDPECTQVFAYDDRDMVSKLADWYADIHERLHDIYAEGKGTEVMRSMWRDVLDGY